VKAFIKTVGFWSAVSSKRRFFQSDVFFKAMVSKRRFFQSDGFFFKATVFFFKAMVFKATVFSKGRFQSDVFFKATDFQIMGLARGLFSNFKLFLKKTYTIIIQERFSKFFCD
jgi:hypothetical protein